jgi:hypothetical protein
MQSIPVGWIPINTKQNKRPSFIDRCMGLQLEKKNITEIACAKCHILTMDGDALEIGYI